MTGSLLYICHCLLELAILGLGQGCNIFREWISQGDTVEEKWPFTVIWWYLDLPKGKRMHMSSKSIRFIYVGREIYSYNVMVYLKEHNESKVKSPVFESSPTQIILHCYNNQKRGIITFHPSDSSPLDHFNFANVHLYVRVPDTGELFLEQPSYIIRLCSRLPVKGQASSQTVKFTW